MYKFLIIIITLISSIATFFSSAVYALDEISSYNTTSEVQNPFLCIMTKWLIQYNGQIPLEELNGYLSNLSTACGDSVNKTDSTDVYIKPIQYLDPNLNKNTILEVWKKSYTNIEMADEYKEFVRLYYSNIDSQINTIFSKWTISTNNTLDSNLINLLKLYDTYDQNYTKIPDTFKNDFVIQIIKNYFQKYAWNEEVLRNLADNENILFLKEYFNRVNNLSDEDVAYVGIWHELFFSDAKNSIISFGVNNRSYPDEDAIAIYNKKWQLLNASDFLMSSVINEWTIDLKIRNDWIYADFRPIFKSRSVTYSPKFSLKIESKKTGKIFTKDFIANFFETIVLNKKNVPAGTTKIPMTPGIEWEIYNWTITSNTDITTIAIPLGRFWHEIYVNSDLVKRIPGAPVTTSYNPQDPQLEWFKSWVELYNYKYIKYFMSSM